MQCFRGAQKAEGTDYVVKLCVSQLSCVLASQLAGSNRTLSCEAFRINGPKECIALNNCILLQMCQMLKYDDVL